MKPVIRPLTLEQAHLVYPTLAMQVKVESILQVVVKGKGLQGIDLVEVKCPPYIHDPSYQEGPKQWEQMFSLEQFGFFAAYIEERLVGLIALAYNTPGCHMLNQREDMVVIFDIRVHLDYQHQRIGTSLMQAAEQWAKQKQAVLMKVETQNTNVKACHFYASQGYHLGEINRYAYTIPLAEEVMLIWYKPL